MTNNSEFKGTIFWIPVLALSVLLFAGLCWLDSSPKPTPHDLVSAGDTKLLQRQVASGADINAQNEDGLSPLHCAVRNEQGSMVDFLLAAGANVNQQSHFKRNTPLHFSVQHEDTTITEKLLVAGANLAVRNKKGETPLCRAVCLNSPSVSVLLGAGAVPDDATCPDGGCLFCASRSGCMVMLEEIVRGLEDLNRLSKQGVSALHYAVYDGRIDVIRFLLENGADVNIRDKRDCTPLHQAVRAGTVELIDLLVENGADLEATDHHGCTPLLLAAKLGHFDDLKKLVKLGADLTAEDNQGLSIDAYARLNRRADMRTFLIEHRRKLSQRGKGAPVAF